MEYRRPRKRAIGVGFGLRHSPLTSYRLAPLRPLRKLRRLYRMIKVPALLAVLCGTGLALVVAFL